MDIHSFRISKNTFFVTLGTGAALLAYVVDTATGELKNIRVIGLGSVISNRLHSFCRTLLNCGPVDHDAYSSEIGDLYSGYPTSEDLLKEVPSPNVFMILSEEA